MKIDGNEIEKAAMKEFHKGNRRNLPRNSARNMRTRITVHVRKHADITATVKNVLRSTGRMGNMCPVVCGL